MRKKEKETTRLVVGKGENFATAVMDVHLCPDGFSEKSPDDIRPHDVIRCAGFLFTVEGINQSPNEGLTQFAVEPHAGAPDIRTATFENTDIVFVKDMHR